MPRSVNPYRCVWCGETRARIGWTLAHEKKCPENPANKKAEQPATSERGEKL